MLEYETANPGQDFDEREHEFFDPSTDTSRPIVNLVSDGSAYVDEGNSRPDSGFPDINNPGPELQQPPAADSRNRQPLGSAMTGGRDDSHNGHDEASASPLPYDKGPDAEAGKASPRE